MKRIILLTFLLIQFVCVSVYPNDFTVVIDAGHGGKDGGAVRGAIKEKEINLKVALNLGKLIEDSFSNVKVVYTRKSDVAVDLDRRAAIANKAKANLYISIHTNSTAAKTTTAAGADTYILGLARSEENKRVQQRENEVILLEDNYKQRYEGFDPNSPESYIIFEFMTNKYMEQSLAFASKVQENFKSVAKRNDRGVKQAGFLVLRETAMPSVLIELGFINNPTEAKYLNSVIGQRAMASSIFEGFKAYKKDFDKKQPNKNTATTNAPVVEEPITQAPQTTVNNTANNRPVENAPKSNTGPFVSKPQTYPVISKPKTEPVVSEQPKQTTPKSEIQTGQTEYRVQILISPTIIKAGSPRFKGLSPVDYYLEKGNYKYTYGSTTNRDEALRLQRQARSKIKDAFIIEFRDGKRVK